MITPLKEWNILKRGYTFGVKTYYSNFHLGLDLLCPIGIPVYAPCDGKITFSGMGKQGGGTIWFEFGGYVIRCLHLSQKRGVGSYKEGDIIGHTGNTGESPTPHLHIDVSIKKIDLNNHSNFIDPEKFFILKSIPIIGINISIPQMQQLQKKIEQLSLGFLTINWNLICRPTDGPVDQAKVYNIADEIYKPNLLPYRYLFLNYVPIPTEVFLTTFYYPQKDMCITKIPNFDARLCSFEIAHQFQTYYDVHRGQNPFIEIVDSNFPDDSLIKDKLLSVLPYRDILVQK